MISKVFYLFAGVLFGFVLIYAGVSNYTVIYEMFLFRSFHMYGLLGVAVGLTFIGAHVLKAIKWKGLLTGVEIPFERLMPTRDHIVGGLISGIGWGLTGACPGPALAQIGFGTLAGIFTATGIFLGVYVYGRSQSE